MHNITIDPLGGIYTRKGWERWNDDDIVDPDDRRPGTRAAPCSPSSPTAPTSSTSPPTTRSVRRRRRHRRSPTPASPVDADAAHGRLRHLRRRHLHRLRPRPTRWLAASAPTPRHAARPRRRPATGTTTTSTPVHGVAPQAELVEAHSGYLFVANIDEDGVDLPQPDPLVPPHQSRTTGRKPTSSTSRSAATQITALHVLRGSPADLQTGLDLGAVRLRRRLVAARPEVVDDRDAVPADA